MMIRMKVVGGAETIVITRGGARRPAVGHGLDRGQEAVTAAAIDRGIGMTTTAIDVTTRTTTGGDGAAGRTTVGDTTMTTRKGETRGVLNATDLGRDRRQVGKLPTHVHATILFRGHRREMLRTRGDPSLVSNAIRRRLLDETTGQYRRQVWRILLVRDPYLYIHRGWGWSRRAVEPDKASTMHLMIFM